MGEETQVAEVQHSRSERQQAGERQLHSGEPHTQEHKGEAAVSPPENPRKVQGVTDPPHSRHPGSHPSSAMCDMGSLFSKKTEPKRLEAPGMTE